MCYSPWGRKSRTQLNAHTHMTDSRTKREGGNEVGLEGTLIKRRQAFSAVYSVVQSRLTLCNPTYCSQQVLLPMEFSREEYWSGWSFPSPGDLPNPGTEPRSPALKVDSLPSEPPTTEALKKT